MQGIYLFVGLLAHLQFRYLAPLQCVGFVTFAAVSFIYRWSCSRPPFHP